MNRYPGDRQDDIFTLAKRFTPKPGQKYIRDLEEGIKTVANVLEGYRDENRRLREKVGELREKIRGVGAWFDGERIYGGRVDEDWDVSETGTRGSRLVAEREEFGYWVDGGGRRSARSNIGIRRNVERYPGRGYEVIEERRPSRRWGDEVYDYKVGGIGGRNRVNYESARDYDQTRSDDESTIQNFERLKIRPPEPRT